MIISKTHKFAFIENPRTGSTSMSFVLKNYNDLKDLDIRKGFRHSNQANVLEILKELNQEIDFTGFYEFVFVRHPYTRFVSLYSMLTKIPPMGFKNTTIKEYKEKIKNFSIDGLLDKYEKVLAGEATHDIIGYSQSQFVVQPLTSNIHIYKYEELKTTWEKIKSDLNLDLGNLPHLNRSPVTGNSDILLPRHKKRIFELFYDEFERFGYEN